MLFFQLRIDDLILSNDVPQHLLRRHTSEREASESRKNLVYVSKITYITENEENERAKVRETSRI